MCRSTRVPACCMLLALLVAMAGAEEAKKPDGTLVPSKWQAERQQAFESYVFQPDEPEGAPLEMELHSILHWSNPERAAGIGCAYLWTHKDRPQLIAGAFMDRDQVQHELQSLASVPLVALRDSREVHRFGSGIEWKPLKDAPEAAEKRALRLSQFRQQARRFQVTFGYKDKWNEARLLTQPVFLSKVANSAIFFFVQGTDPECAVLLSIADDKRWTYAVARQTTVGLKVKLDDDLVWERNPTWTEPDASFAVLGE